MAVLIRSSSILSGYHATLVCRTKLLKYFYKIENNTLHTVDVKPEKIHPGGFQHAWQDIQMESQISGYLTTQLWSCFCTFDSTLCV